MPKKEKSRIITGSKQEKALFIVVVLLLLPVSYGVVNGFPDLAGVLGAGDHGNNSTNKTKNSTIGNLAKKATSDLRSPNSYPNPTKLTKYMPYNSTKTNQTVNNSQDTEQDLLDWLYDNPPIEDNNTQNTQTNQNNTGSITDVLFDDLSSNTDNLAAGEQQEQNITMEDDSSSHVPQNYTGVNPDDDWNYEDYNEEDYGDPGFFFLMGSLLSVLGGAALVK